jgi:hypothetical protein
MTLHLHSTRIPSGHCLLLAQALDRVAKSSRSSRIAEELFAGKHPSGNPVVVNVGDETALPHLGELCTQYGISMKVEVEGVER